MKIKANAKINLALDIVGKRADGYHNLRSVMQSVTLSDTIHIEKSDVITVDCDTPSLSGECNLVFKAAKLFFKSSGIKGGAKIRLEKHIPILAGLGGGSADAAAVLGGLNALFCEPLKREELLEIGLILGADVPFCFTGGTALAEGIGEKLTNLTKMPKCTFLIAKKGVKTSTKDAYAAIDMGTAQRLSDIDIIKTSLERGDLKNLVKGLYNRFEEVSDKAVLCEAKDIMRQNGALYAGLSGAGPSVFGIFEDESNARLAESALSKAEFETYVCEPAAKGFEIIE